MGNIMNQTTPRKGFPLGKKGLILLALLAVAMALASAPAAAWDIRSSDLYRVQWSGQQAPEPVLPGMAEPVQAYSSATAHAIGTLPTDDPNDAFNALWLSEHRSGYTAYTGTQAGHKVVQLWARALWQRFGASRNDTLDYLVVHLDTAREYTPHHGNRKGEMDYRLGLSAHDMELKLNYSFY